MAVNIEELGDFLGLVNRTNSATHAGRWGRNVVTPIDRDIRTYGWDTTVTMSGSSFTVNEELLRYVTYGRGIPIEELQKRAERTEIDTSDVQDFLDGIEVIGD